MAALKISETDLFNPVKGWLEEREYDVFSEVSPKYASGRADIIARRSPAIAIVELKTTLSLDLLDQAYAWKSHAHYIYIAIPRRKKPLPLLVRDFLTRNRIGLLEIDFKSYNRVIQRIPAKFNRPIRDNIDWSKELLPEHKTFAIGGSAGGGYVTPYKLTIERVKSLLKSQKAKGVNDGWMKINEILDHCETHYAAPKSSLSKALREFEGGWCESGIIDRRLHFRIKEEVKRWF